MQGGNKDFWLSDDPEWDELKRRSEGRSIKKRTPKLTGRLKRSERPYAFGGEAPKAPAPAQPPQSSTPKEAKKINLSVDLTIPKLKLPKIKPPKLPKLTKKQVRLGVICGGVLASGLVVVLVVSLLGNGKKPDGQGVLSDTNQKPSFDTVLPNGKEDDAADKVKFDPQKQVASFTDNIGTTQITVSQQPLPEPFKEDTDEKVKKFAEGYNAKTVINESNPKAYIGTSGKGPQTVIFTKNNLLIFIKSANTIDKDQWADYITRLL